MGLSFELPVTFRQFDETATDDAVLYLETEHVTVFPDYPGHLVTMIAYSEDPVGSYKWKETMLVPAIRIVDERPVAIPLPLAMLPNPSKPPKIVFASARVRADTTVAPGLYGDFVVTSLSLKSGAHGYYASFGFQTPV